MHDYNASPDAVERTMDMLEAYRSELSDRRAANAFALTDLQQTMDRAVYRCAAELDDLWSRNDDPDYTRNMGRRLQEKLDALRDLQHRCSVMAAELLENWNSRCGECDRLAEEGFAEAGRYLKKLNKAVGIPPAGTVRTVIVDSARHGQAAEHLRVGYNLGVPQVVTIDRPGAPGRRSDSLSETPTRPDFDRDEVPGAMFAEGGEGAHVAYIAASDNRGAGSSLAHQVRDLPDGTRVRIRII